MSSPDSAPIIHGPQKTQRFGSALLFDITAPQVNLVVERGSVLPRASLIVTSAARRIIELSKAGEKVESIVITGSDVDPAQHPDLKEITENIRTLRDKWFSRAKLCLYSTSPQPAEDSSQAQALLMFDRMIRTFEWGTAKTYTTLTGEKGTVLTSLTKHLSGFEHLVVQASFCKGKADNSTESEIKNWIKKLQEVSPQEVHIITGCVRDGKKVKGITKTRQKQIIDEVVEKTGLAVTVLEEEALLV